MRSQRRCALEPSVFTFTPKSKQHSTVTGQLQGPPLRLEETPSGFAVLQLIGCTNAPPEGQGLGPVILSPTCPGAGLQNKLIYSKAGQVQLSHSYSTSSLTYTYN